jgi:hypothetical protein
MAKIGTVAVKPVMPEMIDANDQISQRRSVADQKKRGRPIDPPRRQGARKSLLDFKPNSNADNDRIKADFYPLRSDGSRRQARGRINIDIFDVEVKECFFVQRNVKSRLCCPAKAAFHLDLGWTNGGNKPFLCLL